MEKLLNRYDKEYMKMAMLKHEETFREQVYELHRLYQIQKMLMKDVSRNPRNNDPVEEFKHVKKCRVSEMEDDHCTDLELTLGPKIYHQRKIKASEPEIPSDSGRSFSTSSTGSSSHVKGASREDQSLNLSRQKWGMENMSSVSNQERLNSPPWLFQALSLNIT